MDEWRPITFLPAELNDFQSVLRFLNVIQIAEASPAATSVQNKMGNPLRIADSVCQSRRAAISHSEQNEPINSRSFNNRLQVFDVSLEGKFHMIAVGQAAATEIIANERVASRQQQKPRTPNRCPVELKMVNPVRNPDQRRSCAANRIGNVGAIATLAKANLLRRMRHRRWATKSSVMIAP